MMRSELCSFWPVSEDAPKLSFGAGGYETVRRGMMAATASCSLRRSCNTTMRLAHALARSALAGLLPAALATLAQILHDPETPDWLRAKVAIQIMEWAGAGERLTGPVEGDPWAALLAELAEMAE